ncbi:MAG: PTS sugar transporter subunit IIA [Limnobacter sp.]|uniref:PTS sugar transporter subunit IIA n=1 Tax=Limnobacter sp. TaxID=2003368 RepID=UPI00391C4A3E
MLGLVLVGHAPLGQATLEVIRHILGEVPEGVVAIDVAADAVVEHTVLRIQEAAKDVNTGEGVVFLTDLFGATPSNAAQRAAAEGLNVPTVLVAGCSVPMLVRALSYRNVPLSEVGEKLVSGGRNGIVSTGPTTPQRQTNNPAPNHDSARHHHQQ